MQKKLAMLLSMVVAVMGINVCNPASVSASEAEETTKTTGKQDEKELIVFAAASMTETLEEIAGMYEEIYPDVTILYNFDSSGTLKTQIEEGADCDIFISAGQKQMNQLDIEAGEEANPDKLDFVASDTRFDILENKVTLCVADNSEAKLASFDDLAAALEEKSVLLCMGNADVPVGQYTQKIFKYYKLNEEELASDGCITYGTNVKEVTTQISEGSVDCGIIYCTDAFSAGLTPVDYATAEMCGQVIYPAAIMKNALQPEAAAEFLEYLQTEECMEVFEKVGFSQVDRK